MTKPSNRPDQIESIRLSFQAREVLSVLSQERSTNENVLGGWLEVMALTISKRGLYDLLDRLEKEGLVRTDVVEGTRVVELRSLGGEVARGVETLDWIAPPELPE